jgi:hypothetical protein
VKIYWHLTGIWRDFDWNVLEFPEKAGTRINPGKVLWDPTGILIAIYRDSRKKKRDPE